MEEKVGKATDEGLDGGNDSEDEESLKAEESAEVEPSNNKQNFTTVNEAVKFVEKLF